MTTNKSASAKVKKAVALKYDQTTSAAPTVIAKGSGSVAEKIIAIAKDKGIQFYQDENLVEVLSCLNVGQEIPEHLYQVVAEILAFVYQLNEKQKHKK